MYLCIPYGNLKRIFGEMKKKEYRRKMWKLATVNKQTIYRYEIYIHSNKILHMIASEHHTEFSVVNGFVYFQHNQEIQQKKWKESVFKGVFACVWHIYTQHRAHRGSAEKS